MEPRQVGLSGCDKEWDSLALVVTAPALGDDFSHGKGARAAPTWKVLSRGPGGSFTTKPAQTFADGIGFAFVTDPDRQLFLTAHPGSGLLGDLTGKTLTATFTITGTATAFTYFAEGEPRKRWPLRRARVRIGAPLLRADHRRPLYGVTPMVVNPAGVHPDEPSEQHPHVDGSARHGELA